MRDRLSGSRAWTQRLETSRAYYRELTADPKKAAEAFRSDFQTLRPLLEESHGCVLDVGGGNGLVRAFLPGIDQYVSIDPSDDWLSADWRPVLQLFPGLPCRLDFVRGVGESLPFADQSFETVLLLFSLNHADDPARVVAETCRVLRPSGVALFALEDVEPPCSWLAQRRSPCGSSTNARSPVPGSECPRASPDSLRKPSWALPAEAASEASDRRRLVPEEGIVPEGRGAERRWLSA